MMDRGKLHPLPSIIYRPSSRAPLRKLKLVLAYDGTRFAGWQRQKNSRSVQAELESALEKITGCASRVIGAGRTDSGVHAQGQVAHAALTTRLPAVTLRRALNAHLPQDLAVLSVRKAPPRFHARYSARKKWYRYSLWNRPQRPVLNRHLLHHLPVRLDLGKMRQAARLLRGRHDFHRFHSAGRPAGSTVRTLSRLSIRKQGGLLLIDAVADGFLYRMVRRLVGLLLEIGRGRVDPSSVKGYFLKERSTPARRRFSGGGKQTIPPSAPAKGLCLMRVWY